MTLLPLMLANGKLGLSPMMVGAAFALQSVVSVAGTAPMAALADKVGPSVVIPPALLLTAASMAAFPMAPDVPSAFAVLGCWALGSAMLGSAPTALAANLATNENRTQVLALFRTMGDVGLLVGASAVGTAATLVGNAPAMQGTGAFTAATAAWFAFSAAQKSR